MPKIQAQVFTVSQVNRYMRRLLEDDALLCGLWVEGELSNVNRHPSGHVYFTLKDEAAAVNAVLFKSHADGMAFSPTNGMKVLVLGRFSLYEKTGQYQLYAEHVQPAGIGSLQTAFEQLRNRLNDEGLFDPSRKKPIPPYINTLAVITSPTGAAVRDIIQTVRQRNPAIRIIIAPTLVQGAEAAKDIARAIKNVNQWNKADVIILGRGGGSAEDLWAFNEEAVARAVAGSRIPIISAVGHETDFTIADFAADVRAATPTAAAVLAAYDLYEAAAQIKHLTHRLSKQMSQALYIRQMHVQTLTKDMHRVLEGRLNKQRATLANATAALQKASPYAAHKQGMAWVRDAKGRPIGSAQGLTAGTRLRLDWHDGSIKVEVV
jgi:exodeoxyribonuclease VII large subunit